MNIQPNPNSRLERILKKLLQQEDLLEQVEKGSIEINFSGSSETVAIKVVIQ